MQLIAETYDLLSAAGSGCRRAEIARRLCRVEPGRAAVLPRRDHGRRADVIDPDTSRPLVDVILDEAQQKGTGKWMSQNAFDVGAPIPTVNAAVEARILSALKIERVAASRVLSGPSSEFAGDRAALIDAARQALYASKITSYAQGMALLRMASDEYRYDIDPGEVARIWRAGCIIRASLLGRHSAPRSRATAASSTCCSTTASATRSARASRPGARRADGRRPGHPGAGHGRVAGLLRRLSQRAPAGEPDAGAARLLRRAHLPPHRPRRRLPHAVDAARPTVDQPDAEPTESDHDHSEPEYPADGALDFLALGALVHRLDPGRRAVPQGADAVTST